MWFATFLGKDGSMGLKKGGLYVIGIQSDPSLNGLEFIVYMMDKKGNVFWECPYSLSGLNANWRRVQYPYAS